jgi:aspartyl protease family protein
MKQNEPINSLGKYFSWAAWLIALALLFFVFQDYLNQQYNPNVEPSIKLTSTGRAEVTLQQNKQGHYVVNGQINEISVTFLLDTGATQVSIPATVADQLNLPNLGQTRVQTANGSVTVYQTTIDQLSIGNIFLYNVPANINPAMQSNEILLGMSALKRIEFQQTGQQLILRER